VWSWALLGTYALLLGDIGEPIDITMIAQHLKAWEACLTKNSGKNKK